MRRLGGAGAAGGGRVWLFGAGLGVASAGVWLAWLRPLAPAPAPTGLPGWLLAGLFCLAEVAVVHLQLRRDAHSFALAEVPLVLGLVFARPTTLLGARLAGSFVALAVWRRQPPAKLAFNLAACAAETALAVLVFRGLAAPGTVGPRAWLGVFLATQAGELAVSAAIAGAVRLSGHEMPAPALARALRLTAAASAINTSLALLAATVVWWAPEAALLLALPVASVGIAYRASARERERHGQLELLNQTTRLLHHSLEPGAAVQALLTQAASLLRAEVAEITLAAPEGGGWLRERLGADDRLVRCELGELEPVLARVAAEGGGRFAPRDAGAPGRSAWLAERGLRDALVVPLSGTEVAGVMLVANRLRNRPGFDDGDARLLETLATHAATSLDNARLVDRLHRSLEELRSSNRLKEDFVAAVSHELRTPLTSIQGCLATLRRTDVELDGEVARSLLEVAHRQSQRLGRLIEDLLVVSRLEAGSESATLADVRLDRLVGQVVEELQPRDREHEVRVEVPEGLAPVRTDGDRLHQILANLVGNARKYAPAGTAITVRARRDPGATVVSVADQGPGIPPEQHERIFDRFYQVDRSSTRRAGGIGLGLYLCRRLADTIGAEVLLERSGPGGSVFSVRLPHPPPPAPAGARPGRAAVATAARPSRR
jgi:signal transduction histidine kinase